ncbi:hypothetical protein [Streptomyces sp. NPDC002566]|uniref:hypothetical protein n=1 Tax=Streptomyces sp. NPDC002566 TaxID=3364650 RepID=UPI0036A4E270
MEQLLAGGVKSLQLAPGEVEQAGVVRGARHAEVGTPMLGQAGLSGDVEQHPQCPDRVDDHRAGS